MFWWVLFRKNSTFYIFVFCDFLQWWSWYIIINIHINKHPQGDIRIKSDLVINISVHNSNAHYKGNMQKSASAINQWMYQTVSKSVYLCINSTVFRVAPLFKTRHFYKRPNTKSTSSTKCNVLLFLSLIRRMLSIPLQ